MYTPHHELFWFKYFKECFNYIVIKGPINRLEAFLLIIVPTFSFFLPRFCVSTLNISIHLL
jgi:hypothetical protein